MNSHDFSGIAKKEQPRLSRETRSCIILSLFASRYRSYPRTSPGADDLKAAGQGVVQAVLIFRADGGPDAHDARAEQGKRRLQQLPLQTVAPVAGVDDGAVGVGPAVPLFSRDAHKGGIVVRALPAVAQDKVGPQPPAVPPADAQVLFQVAGDVSSVSGTNCSGWGIAARTSFCKA